MTTDSSEKRMENLIVEAMNGQPARQTGPAGPGVTEPTALYCGTARILRAWRDHEHKHCVHFVELAAFLCCTQIEVIELNEPEKSFGLHATLEEAEA